MTSDSRNLKNIHDDEEQGQEQDRDILHQCMDLWTEDFKSIPSLSTYMYMYVYT